MDSSSSSSTALKEFLAMMQRIVPGRVHLVDSSNKELVYTSSGSESVTLSFSGVIHGRCGPMFSEKSRWLISSLDKALKAGRRVCPMKPSIDTRDKGMHTRSNGGRSIACTLLDGGDLSSAVDMLIRERVEVVGIDELHFLEEAYPFCALLQALGMEVFVAFLDGTFLQRTFKPTPDLFALMYDYEKTRTYCYQCPYGHQGQHAVCTIKFRADDGGDSSGGAEDDKAAHVGGEECYVAVCRRCSMEFHLGNRRYDAPSVLLIH